MKLLSRGATPNNFEAGNSLNDYDFFLKVNVEVAADLAPAATNNWIDVSDKARRKINPVIVCQLNSVKQKTSRKLHSKLPTWNSTLIFPLSPQCTFKVLVLTVWDKHRKYKNYLGELRLSLYDLFYDKGVLRSESESKWYRLYSNSSKHSYVTGSVLLSFLIAKRLRKNKSIVKREKKTISRKALEDPDTLIPFDEIAHIQPKNFKQEEEVKKNIFKESVEKSEQDANMVQEWLERLLRPETDSPLTKPDEQGFYEDAISNYSLSDTSDIESVESYENKQENIFSRKDKIGFSDYYEEGSSSSSDDSSTSGQEDKNNESYNVGIVDLEMPRKQHQKRKKKSKRAKGKTENFKLSHRNIMGVLFLEIISLSELPPFKSFHRTAFDMDPFVVVSFGKKTFRTSWKRHTLNPLFNERIAFEVLEHEKDFDVAFHVLDKDRFSFNDRIASGTVQVNNLTNLKDTRDSKSKENDETDFDNSINDIESGALDSSITVVDENNMVQLVKRGKFTGRKKNKFVHTDTSKFRTLHLNLKLDDARYAEKYHPSLKFRVRFEPYENLWRHFWRLILEQFELNDDGKYDYIELSSLFETLGCEDCDELVKSIFSYFSKLAWGGDILTIDEILDALGSQSSDNFRYKKVLEFEKCPICLQKRLSNRQDIDIVTHVAICSSKDWSIVNKLLVSSYVSQEVASKRWYSKMLINLTYGKYKLGVNSANILVQDRTTGVILEERIGVSVKLGIRLLYNLFDKAKTKRIRTLLRKLSTRQGAKFDSPQLKRDIEAFVRFHRLDLSDFVESDINKYNSFNEFFYRKIKAEARPIERPNDCRTVTSPADCRCCAFSTVEEGTKIWIKGENFSLAKLFHGNFCNLQGTNFFKASECSLGIFRLAPQDYHRFHSPVDGHIKRILHIEGEYYTVNPMAVRSKLDVFGENVRTLILIETEEFGTIIMIAVGAMMVGSIVLTKGEEDKVVRGEEVGYFKFGGSTILLLLEKEKFLFDSDLLNNSTSAVETLTRVGQSIGHSPSIDEYKRARVDFALQSSEFRNKLIRTLTGGDLESSGLSNWEYTHTDIDSINDFDLDSIELSDD